MAMKLDLHMMVPTSLSHQITLNLLCVVGMWSQSKALTLEQLWLNFMPMMILSIVVSPLTTSLLQQQLDILSMFGTSLAQNLTSLRPLWGIVMISTSLAFLSPSTLISSSWDESVKFWQIEILPTAPVITDPKSTSSTSSPIRSVSLQVKDGIAISSDSSGVVKTWDILTGLCKGSFQTPAQHYGYSDAHLIKGSLIFIWDDRDGIHFWDSNEDKLEKQVLDITQCRGLRISEDGSKVFCLTSSVIQVWSIWTWECVGEVQHAMTSPFLNPLHTDHSKIWIMSQDSTQGWDFEISSSPPVPLSNMPTEKSHLDLIWESLWKYGGVTRIKDRETGKEVFRLSGRYANPSNMRWDGQYLVAGYESGEVFILDFYHLNTE